jgi:hypothetical protein
MSDPYSFGGVLKQAQDAFRCGKEGLTLYIKRAGNKIVEIWFSFTRRF